MCPKSIPHSPHANCSTGPWTPDPPPSNLRCGSKGRELEMAQLFFSCRECQPPSPTPGTFLRVSPPGDRDRAFLHHLISLMCRGVRQPPSPPEASKQGQLQDSMGIQTRKKPGSRGFLCGPTELAETPPCPTQGTTILGEVFLSTWKR